MIESEEGIDYIAEAPRTPGDLEKQFPPVEKPSEGTKTG